MVAKSPWHTFEISLTNFDREILRIHHFQDTNSLLLASPGGVVRRYEYLEGILVCRSTSPNYYQLYEPKENREAIENAIKYNIDFAKGVTEGDLSYLLGTLELCMQLESNHELEDKVDLVGGTYSFVTTPVLAKRFGVTDGTVSEHMNRLVGLVSYFLGKVSYYPNNGRAAAKKGSRKRFYYIPFARRDYIFGFLEAAGKIDSKEGFLKNLETQQTKITSSF